MNAALLTQLPPLLPSVVEWVEAQQNLILARGVPIDDRMMHAARLVGVRQPERIRLLAVSRIEPPTDPVLAQAARETGLITDNTAGMTLGYGIFIRADCWGQPRLVTHECAHVGQFERLGLAGFLQSYLAECIQIGYPNGPLERDAIAAERHAPR